MIKNCYFSPVKIRNIVKKGAFCARIRYTYLGYLGELRRILYWVIEYVDRPGSVAAALFMFQSSREFPF